MTKPTETETEAKPVVAAGFTDLANLNTATKSDEGAEIELEHPITQEPLGIFINLLGKHSQIFRDHVRERVNKRMAAEALANRRGKPLPPPTAEQAEADAIDLLTLCTLGWRSETYERDAAGSIVKNADGTRKVIANEPVIVMGGEKLSHTVVNAKVVYGTMIWAREQVDNGIGDLENFIKG